MRGLIQADLCVLLAVAMWLAPVAAVRSQLPEPTGKPGIDTRFCTPQTVAVAYLQPKRIMDSPVAELLPTEVATAAGLKYLGIDPASIESVQVVVEPPMGTTLFGAAIIKTSEAIDIEAVMAKLPPEIGGQFTKAEAGGRPFYKPGQPELPAAYLPDDNTLVIATMPMLKKLFAKPSSQSGPVLDRLTATPVDDDFFLMVDTETLRPLISMGLMQAAQEVPPEAQKFLDAPQYVRDVELSVNLTGKGPTQLLLHANDSADATKLVELLSEAKAMGQAQQQPEIARMLASDDTIEQAMGQYMQRMQTQMNAIEPQVEGDTLTIFKFDDANIGSNPMVSIAIIGVLVALLLPAVQAAREAARRNVSMNNMKQLMILLLNYDATYGNLPPHAIYSNEGKPLLSWRVAVLPYLEQKQLYDQFKLDEPWDSEHNLKLAKQMPEVFLDPSSTLTAADGKTHYLAVGGKSGIFPDRKVGTKLVEVSDGTSNTIAIVQVDDEHAVPWTKPADFTPDADNPTAGLGGINAGEIALAAFCDGSVQVLSLDIDAEVLKAMFTRNGGEVVGNDF